jgi:methionyl-tRNA formyltransferase
MPGAWAIIEGQKEFGVTMHHIDVGVDSGDIIAQEMFEIRDDDTGHSLYKRCEEAGLRLFKRTFPLIKDGKAGRTPQDKSKVIYHKRGLPNDRYINWNLPGCEIYNFIRALQFPPFPGPRTLSGHGEVIVKSSRLTSAASGTMPGEVLKISSPDKAIVATKDADILVETEKAAILKKGEILANPRILTRLEL